MKGGQAITQPLREPWIISLVDISSKKGFFFIRMTMSFKEPLFESFFVLWIFEKLLNVFCSSLSKGANLVLR